MNALVWETLWQEEPSIYGKSLLGGLLPPQIVIPLMIYDVYRAWPGGETLNES